MPCACTTKRPREGKKAIEVDDPPVSFGCLALGVLSGRLLWAVEF